MKPGEIAHSVSRGAFYLAIEKVAALISGLLYFALLLRWLGPTKYGIMTLALSFAGLATMATGNFEVFLERYAAQYQAQGRLATLRRAHLLALGVKLAARRAGERGARWPPSWRGSFAHAASSRRAADAGRAGGHRRALDDRRAMLFGSSEFRWVSAARGAVPHHQDPDGRRPVGAAPGTPGARDGARDPDRPAGAGPDDPAVVDPPECPRSGSGGSGGLRGPLAAARQDARPGRPSGARGDAASLLRSVFVYCVPLLGARARSCRART